MFDATYSDSKSVKVSFFSMPQKLLNRLWHSNSLFMILGAIAISLISSKSITAQSFGGYCVSPANRKNLEQKPEIDLYQDADYPSVSVRRGGEEYVIAVDQDNPRQIVLRRAQEQSAISQMTFAPDGGKIKNLALGKDDWLWINKNAIDYVMKVNFAQEKSSFEAPIQLPELSVQPCHFFRRLLQKCPHQEYIYSHSLQRIFVSGYPLKSWRKRKYLHLEYVSGEEIPVPRSLEHATFIADIPEWNGALFRKFSGEALFYDGTTVIDLSSDFKQLENGDNFRDWDIKRTAGGRSFIGKFTGRTDNEPLFLMELKAQPGFKPIYLSEDFKHKWLDIFTFPDDSNHLLWIITRKTIFIETKQKVKAVIALPLSFFIERANKKEFTSPEQSNNFISFTVKNYQNAADIDYLIQEKSTNTPCETTVDFNKKTILQKR